MNYEQQVSISSVCLELVVHASWYIDDNINIVNKICG